jgi:hypothetical protein
MEGSGRDLFEVLSRHSLGGTEVNHTELRSCIEVDMAEMCRKLHAEVSGSIKKLRTEQ